MNRIATPLLALVSMLVLAACDSVTEAPVELAPQVTFGQLDVDGDYPHVVTLLFTHDGDDFYSCTGTLLSPTVVLTAGHCVEAEGDENDATYVRNATDALSDIGAYETTQAWLDAEWVEAVDVVPHPDYDDFAAFPDTFDVGLVLLPDSGAFDGLAQYGELAEVGLLEELLTGRKHRDRQFTVVGYGLQGAIPAFYSDDYQRYFGRTTLINVNSSYGGNDSTAVFTNSPGKGNGAGGACYGDSGGPLFYGDSNVIGAVVSYGITECIGPDFQFRVDTQDVHDFVGPYLDWDGAVDD